MSGPSSGVTAIMPSWNQAQWIRQSLDSLVSDPAVTEIWVMDRQSTDGTVALLDTFGRGSLHVGPGFRSPLAAISEGITRATNEWLVVATTSDWFEPQAVSTLLRAAGRDPRCACVGGGTIIHEVDGRRRLKLPIPGAVTVDDVIAGGQNPGIVLFRASLAREVGPLEGREDGLWYAAYLLHALTHGWTARRLARPLINMRRHAGSLSGSAEHAATVHEENTKKRVRLAQQYAGVLTPAQCERLARPADGYEPPGRRLRRRVARWWYAP